MSRLHLKKGDFEIEFEGDEKFLTTELVSLVERLNSATPRVAESNHASSGRNGRSIVPQNLEGTTSDFAARLKAKSGPELAVAAAACLTLARGTPRFGRKDLSAEMRSATHHYKETYGKHLTEYLGSLLSQNKFREIAPSTYSLDSGELTRVTEQLGHE